MLLYSRSQSASSPLHAQSARLARPRAAARLENIFRAISGYSCCRFFAGLASGGLDGSKRVAATLACRRQGDEVVVVAAVVKRPQQANRKRQVLHFIFRNTKASKNEGILLNYEHYSYNACIRPGDHDKSYSRPRGGARGEAACARHRMPIITHACAARCVRQQALSPPTHVVVNMKPLRGPEEALAGEAQRQFAESCAARPGRSLGRPGRVYTTQEGRGGD